MKTKKTTPKKKTLEKRIEEIEEKLGYIGVTQFVIIPPLVPTYQAIHYHNGIPCDKNPCVWC